MELGILLIALIGFIVFYYITNIEKEKEEFKIKYVPKTVDVSDKIYTYINEYRKENNLLPVFPEQTLINTSLERVKFLKDQGTLTHNGFTSINIGTSSLGEVIAKGYKTDLGLFNAYKKSPIHSKILLGKNFLYVGSSTLDGYNCILFAK